MLLVLLGLAALAYRARRRALRLERLLQAAHDKLEALQCQFERFLPADVVERLTGDADNFAPERRQVTMLFADLRDFTALSDRLDPAVTLGVLNAYFQHMTEAIVRHHGHVTEFVGDGLLALFGALEPNPWQQRDAVLAALEMRAALARFNIELGERGLPQLRFGIGVHGGEVIAGVIGTAGLSKFSVTGDPINVASRVEGLSSRFGVDVLISEEVAAALDARFRLQPMPAAYVKGKLKPMRTYTVACDGDRAEGTSMKKGPTMTGKSLI